jgi:hypothetical protein
VKYIITIIILIFSLLAAKENLWAQEDFNTEDNTGSETTSAADVKRDYPYLILGAEFYFAVSVLKESLVIPTSSGGAGISGGIFINIFPVKFFTIQTGLNYRTHRVGLFSDDITYSELQIPILPLFALQVNEGTDLLLGVGISWFSQISGTINKTVAKQEPIPIEKADLISDFSYIIRIGIRDRGLFGSDNLYGYANAGFEYAERSLRIITREISFSFGAGIKVF